VSDDVPFYAPNRAAALRPREPKPGELLWEFVRDSDHRHFRCELRFHGESYGWEAQFFESGEVYATHGAFVTRELAERWAVATRRAIERGALDEL
jgi:hypothetical protein